MDYYDGNETVQLRLHKSLKLWSFYVDLEECYGTFQTCKAVYDRILDLRIATPQIIINYGMYLEENKYFEDAFRTYERGIALFKWPNVYDIWLTYLCKFVERYADGSKLERARDLFEQCLEHCPAKFAKNLYLLYAKLEEQHGLDRRALKIYERATSAVEAKEKEEVKRTNFFSLIVHFLPLRRCLIFISNAVEKCKVLLPHEKSTRKQSKHWKKNVQFEKCVYVMQN